MMLSPTESANATAMSTAVVANAAIYCQGIIQGFDIGLLLFTLTTLFRVDLYTSETLAAH